MAKADFRSVDEYIAAQPEPARAPLALVRSAIRHAIPAAEEGISYKIPTYRMHGAPVLYFAGWKRHYSLYPVGEHIMAAFTNELAPYKVDKSTIRFPLSQPVPVKLIEGIAKLRAMEVAEKAKKATRKER